MWLSELAEIGSFISGVAILASLIFLYFQLRQINRQIRQAEKNQQSAIRQGRAGRSIGIVLTGAEPSLADAFVKGAFGDNDISLTQLSQFSAVCRATIMNSEPARAAPRAKASTGLTRCSAQATHVSRPMPAISRMR
jgi:hypothetical protein